MGKGSKVFLPLHLLGVFLLLFAAIGAAGYAYFYRQKEDILQATQEELSAIADAKVRQITNWRVERIGDATEIHDGRFVAPPLIRYLKGRLAPGLRPEIAAWMKSMQKHYSYKNILLVDPGGEVLLSAEPDEKRLGPELATQSREALRTDHVIFVDFFKDPRSQSFDLNLIVPLLDHQEGTPVPAGVLILRISPDQFLFPLLNSWPTASETAETLLVRREGRAFIYLNPRRGKTGRQLPAPLPGHTLLTDELLPGNRERIMRGKDYRGAPVIAALRRIPDSPWLLVTKVDVEEAYAAVRQEARSVGAFIGMLVLGSGFGVCLWWLHRNRQMAIQLGASEARYRSLFENSPISLWQNDFSGIKAKIDALRNAGVVDLASHFASHPEDAATCFRALRVVDVNQATLKVFKARQKEALVQNLGRLLRRESYDAFCCALVAFAKGGTEFQYETTLQTLEGDVLKVIVRLSLQPGHERTWANVIATVLDITEQKRATDLLAGQNRVLEMIVTGEPLERVLENLVRFIESHCDGMLGSILLLNADGLHVRNGAAPSLPDAFNRAIDGEPIGPEAGSCGTAMYLGKQVVVTDIQSDPLWGNYRKLAERHGLRACWSTPIISHQNKVLGSFAMYYRRVRSPSPHEYQMIDLATSTACVAIEHFQAHEALDRARAELELRVEERTRELNEVNDKLRLANEGLQEVDRLKSMFIASMSHELRTPLNSIIGFSSILLHEWAGKLSTEQNENLAIVLRAGKHLLSLINDVIDVSKIEAGQVAISLEETDLYQVVGSAVEMVESDFRAKGLNLAVEVPHQVMQTDPKRLLQCLLNLLSNALKYTREGEVHLTARRTGDRVEIEVADTGIGIRQEDSARIFQAFSRLRTLQTTVPGTGLGLYLTRKLVTEILRGEISFTSEFGKGSTFVICIPVTYEAAQETVG